MKKIEIIATLKKYNVIVDESLSYNELSKMLKAVEQKAQSNDIIIEYATIDECANALRSIILHDIVERMSDNIRVCTTKHKAFSLTSDFAYCSRWSDYENAVILEDVKTKTVVFEMWLHKVTQNDAIDRIDFCIDESIFDDIKQYISDDVFEYSERTTYNGKRVIRGYKNKVSNVTCTHVFDALPIEYALHIVNALSVTYEKRVAM